MSEDIISDWKGFLETESTRDEVKKLKTHEKTGRPLGGKKFIEVLEKTSGRNLQIKKLGPKKQKDK